MTPARRDAAAGSGGPVLTLQAGDRELLMREAITRLNAPDLADLRAAPR
jgi:hypothetical protein